MPRVLIVGQSFNRNTGGGITLSNLFNGWDKNNIAVVCTGHLLDENTDTSICRYNYQLGREEQKWIFPFNRFQRSFPSGLIEIKPKSSKQPNKVKNSLRYRVVNQLFFPVCRWLGVFHFASKIVLSKQLESWLVQFAPDVLYLQASDRETILFARQLVDFLKIPAVIHVMDDWPSTISNKGIFKNFWHKKIDFEYRQLLASVNVHLSISHAMSEAYKTRYRLPFRAFHNPTDIDAWLPYSKSNFELDRQHVTILYAGRIGISVTESLVEVASAIDQMKSQDLSIKLHIQTQTNEVAVLNELKKHDCVILNPFADYNDLPKIFAQADILLIANDFNDSGSAYLKYSMPTKASEYMISGAPVLVYSPRVSAVTKFFSENDCGCCVTEQDPQKIIEAITLLVGDEKYRKKLSRNAVGLAKDQFDAQKVRGDFQKLLKDLSVNVNTSVKTSSNTLLRYSPASC